MLIEWTDTNLRNVTFEGTAREVMRVQLNHRIHPMGEVVFHPTARRGDPEWRVMYIGIGDGGAGEMRTIARPNPQRLDTLVGKILRIIPDPAEHVGHQHAERERPLPHSERQPVRRRSPAPRRRSGRTASAILTG